MVIKRTPGEPRDPQALDTDTEWVSVRLAQIEKELDMHRNGLSQLTGYEIKRIRLSRSWLTGSDPKAASEIRPQDSHDGEFWL
jgi:hypothetical protein